MLNFHDHNWQIRFDGPTPKAFQQLWQLAVAYLGYDFMFYWSHRLLHHPKICECSLTLLGTCFPSCLPALFFPASCQRERVYDGHKLTELSLNTPHILYSSQTSIFTFTTTDSSRRLEREPRTSTLSRVSRRCRSALPTSVQAQANVVPSRQRLNTPTYSTGSTGSSLLALQDGSVATSTTRRSFSTTYSVG